MPVLPHTVRAAPHVLYAFNIFFGIGKAYAQQVALLTNGPVFYIQFYPARGVNAPLKFCLYSL
jgi:hypothetical protein